MSNFLLKIRNKPDKEKKKIFIISMIMAMVLVVACWFGLNHFFGNEYGKINNNKSNNSVKFLIGVFEKTFENLGTEINKTKNTFSQ